MSNNQTASLKVWSMLDDVVEVMALKPYRLHVGFDDGMAGELMWHD
jgi:hypothetical protein